jgi:hypothetical protein
MRLIPPHDLTFVSSTAEVSTLGAWSSATTYNAGDRVQVAPAAAINAPGGTESYDRTIDLAGLPIETAARYAVTIGSDTFSYSAVKGDTRTTVATRLATAIDDHEAYQASSVGEIVTIGTGAGLAAVSFSTSAAVHEYEAAQTGTNKPPATNPAFWTDLGVSNPYRLLDAYVSSQTQSANSFTTSVDVVGRFDKIAFFALDGAVSARVQLAYNGAEVYDETFPLSLASVVESWWDYFFGSIEYADSAILDIPGTYDRCTVSVTLNGNSGTIVKCGHLTIGQSLLLGATQYDVKLGITDYSTKITNDFGDTEFVERAFVKNLSYDLEIERGNEDMVFRALSAVRAVPSVYDANPDASPTPLSSLRVFGYFTEFSVQLKTFNGTYCSLDVEGLV